MYSFEKSEDYYIKRFTTNKAQYYASEKFEEKYSISSMSLREKEALYQEIDNSYYEYLQAKCSRIMKHKQDLQYKMYYYSNYPRYLEAFQREYNRIDMTVCNTYNNFAKYVR